MKDTDRKCKYVITFGYDVGLISKPSKVLTFFGKIKAEIKKMEKENTSERTFVIPLNAERNDVGEIMFYKRGKNDFISNQSNTFLNQLVAIHSESNVDDDRKYIGVICHIKKIFDK